MKLRVAIFEDDSDLSELLEELLEASHYEVKTCLSLKNFKWDSIDIALGDYKNTIVSFKDLDKQCKENKVPLIAISGGDMDYPHQLTKPFGIEELEGLMFDLLKKSSPNRDQSNQSALSKWLDKMIPEE